MSNDTPLNEFVSDTVGLVIHLEKRKLGKQATEIFKSADTGDIIIHIPSMVFAEILYLYEKNRLSVSLSIVEKHITQHPNYKEAPLNLCVIRTASTIEDIKELHDRLIVATAKHLSLPLITNDSVIQRSKHTKTVW